MLNELGEDLKGTHQGDDAVFNRSLDQLVGEVKSDPEFSAMHSFLKGLNAVPRMERDFSGNRGSFEYEPGDDVGTLRVSSNSDNPRATLIHEMTHAAERQMDKLHSRLKKKKGGLTEQEERFVTAYEKSLKPILRIGERRHRSGVSDVAKALNERWFEGNREYATSNSEINAQALGSVKGARRKAPTGHISPSIATEFMLVLQLAQDVITK